MNTLSEALAIPSQGVGASLKAFRHMGGVVDTEKLQGLVEEVATRYGYKVPVVKLRKLKYWYGVCYTRDNTVVLDRGIVEANNEEAVSRLVRHELAHFKVRSHSKAFGEELERMGLQVYHRELQGWYEVGHYLDPRREEKYGIPVQLGHHDVNR
jgi:hypothetical protein